MSTSNKPCLQNLVGLSQTPCDCWTDKPEDYNTSISGLFIDELLPISNFTNLENCEDQDVWTLLDKSREEAMQRMMTDVKQGLFKKFDPAYNYFKGKIGEAKGTVVQNFGNAFAGVCLRCNPLKSGVVRINAVGALFNTTGTKHIYVMNNLGELITEFDITTTANVYVNNTLAAAITLNLYDERTEVTHYYFFYAKETNSPLNNTISCNNCGFTPCWSMGNECWHREPKNNRFVWSKYVQVSGITFNTQDDLYNVNYGLCNALYGLTLDIDAYCSIDDIFCVDDIVYAANAYYTDMAFAIRYKAAEYAINNNLLSDKLTRANLINRETIMQMQEYWQAEYAKNIAQIVDNIDVSYTSCLKCRDKWGVRNKLAVS